MTLLEQIDEIIENLGLGEDDICHCGSIHDAFDIAEKLVSESYQHNCPAWMLQVSLAHAMLARKLFDETFKKHDLTTRNNMFQHVFDKMHKHLDDHVKTLISNPEIAKILKETDIG